MFPNLFPNLRQLTSQRLASKWQLRSGIAVVQENVVLGDTGCQPTLQLEDFIVVRTYLTYPPSHQEEVRLVDLLGICQQPNSG